MAYIVPSEMPKSCVGCFFGYCTYSHPWVDSRNKKIGKGYRCQLDPQKRVLDMEYNDETSKAEWCPLKEMVGDNEVKWSRQGKCPITPEQFNAIYEDKEGENDE